MHVCLRINPLQSHLKFMCRYNASPVPSEIPDEHEHKTGFRCRQLQGKQLIAHHCVILKILPLSDSMDN
jgi:hypothetical protein